MYMPFPKHKQSFIKEECKNVSPHTEYRPGIHTVFRNSCRWWVMIQLFQWRILSFYLHLRIKAIKVRLEGAGLFYQPLQYFVVTGYIIQCNYEDMTCISPTTSLTWIISVGLWSATLQPSVWRKTRNKTRGCIWHEMLASQIPVCSGTVMCSLQSPLTTALPPLSSCLTIGPSSGSFSILSLTSCKQPQKTSVNFN